MMNYNYREAVAQDVRQWLEDHADDLPTFEDGSEMYEYLTDALWCEDSVTGNGSGSYTFCRATAREYVLADPDTVLEAVRELCCGFDAAELLQKLLNGDWEYFDVTARCYVLGEAVWTVADERFSDCA